MSDSTTVSALLFLLLLNSGIASAFLFLIPAKEHHFQLNSVRYFRSYFIIICVGFLSYAVRPMVPLSLSVFFANGALITAVYCVVCGIYWRYHKAVHIYHPFIAIHIIAFTLVITALGYLKPDNALLRMVFVYINVTSVMLYALSLFGRFREDTAHTSKLLMFSIAISAIGIIVIPIAHYATDSPMAYLYVLLIVQNAIVLLLFGAVIYTLFFDVLDLYQKGASLDPTTDLYNRRYFFEQANKFLHAAERHQFPMSIIICDIDKFATVNDEHGHFAGDYVIRAMADTIKQETREEDLVARYGGKEFVALLPQTRLAGALLIAERMRNKIERLQVDYQHKTIQLTASLGVTCISEFTDIETSLHAADQALREAKKNGYNRVEHTP